MNRDEMLLDLVNTVNFNDSGAFIEQPPQRSNGEHKAHPLSAKDEGHRHEGSSGPGIVELCMPAESSASSTPSFESFLTVPREFVARHAMHSAMDMTLLLDLMRIAVEMDAIVDCALEQLHDHQQLTLALNKANPGATSAGASLGTTLVVLLRQASQETRETMVELLQRLQGCIRQLALLRYPLAQRIESILSSSSEISDGQRASSFHRIADVEIHLLDRLQSVLDSNLDFRMTPLQVPKCTNDSRQTEVCWSSSSASSPSRTHEVVFLGGGVESLTSPNIRASVQQSPSLTQTESVLHSTSSQGFDG